MRFDYIDDTKAEIQRFNTDTMEHIQRVKSHIEFLTRTRDQVDAEIKRLETTASALSKVAAEESPEPVHPRSATRFDRGNYGKTLTGNADRLPRTEPETELHKAGAA